MGIVNDQPKLRAKPVNVTVSGSHDEPFGRMSRTVSQVIRGRAT
jgi:hypothetical protein